MPNQGNSAIAPDPMAVGGLSRYPGRATHWLVGAVVVALLATFVGTAMRDAAAVGKPSGCQSAPAGALHVAKTGSDSTGNGSASKPWRTISHAVDEASSGSTIVIHAGTYRESVVIRAKRINLMSAPGDTVWLSGSDKVTGWTKSGDTWRATPAKSGKDRRSAFDDKRMLDSSNRIAGHLAMVFIDGVPQKQVSSVSAVTPGTFAVSSGVYYLGSNPTGKQVDVAHREVGLFVDDAGRSEISGLGFKHYATPEVLDGAVRIAVDSPNVVIRDNVFANNANVGLQVRGTNARILDNTFENNGRLALSANNADDMLVRGNLIENNNNEHFATDAAAGGIKISASRRVDVDANHLTGNTGAGVWVDRSSLGIDITRNRSVDNTKHAFHIEASAKVRLVSNSSVDDQIGVRVSDSNNVDIYNNVVIGAVQSISAQDGPRNSATSQGGSFGLPHDSRYSFPIPEITWVLEDLVVKNNLFVGGAGGNPMLYVNDSAGDLYGNEMAVANHNIFHRGFHGSPTYVVGWSGGPDPYERYKTVAAWKADQGQGAGDLEKSGSSLGSVKSFPGNLAPAGPALGAGGSIPSNIASLVGYSGSNPPIGLLTSNSGPYGHCQGEAPPLPSTTTTTTTTTQPSTSDAPAITWAFSAHARARFAWSATQLDAPLLEYRVFRNGTRIGETTGRTYTDVHAEVGESYWYAVRAVDTAGNLSDPAGALITVKPLDTKAPSAPSSIQASNIGNSTATITWGKATDNQAVKAYLVFRNGNYVGRVDRTEARRWVDTGLSSGTTYRYEIVAKDYGGNASPAAAKTITTSGSGGGDTTAPSKPSNVRTTSGNNKVTVTWGSSSDAGSGVKAYLVYRDWKYIDRVKVGEARTFTHTGLTNGKDYRFQVRAKDYAGNISEPSAMVIAKPGS